MPPCPPTSNSNQRTPGTPCPAESIKQCTTNCPNPAAPQAQSAGTKTAPERHSPASDSSELESDGSAQDCPQKPRFLLHSTGHDLFTCDRLVCPSELIVEGSWQPDAYAAWHRLAWSGMLGAAVLLFPAHTLTLQAHEQLLALLRAAHLQGCHVYFEYPVVNLSQIEDQYVQICQELAAHCTQVRLWQDQHSVVICSTDSSISKLASHCDGLHALSSIAAKHCTSLLQAPIKVEALPKYMSPCYLPKRPAVCDGAAEHVEFLCGLPRQHGETNSHTLGHVAATPRTASRSRKPKDQKQGRRASCAAIAQAPVGTPCRPAPRRNTSAPRKQIRTRMAGPVLRT